MVQVLVFTQFVFLALGVVALKILVHAGSAPPPGTLLAAVNQWFFLLFAIPLIWGGFARVCDIVNRAPLKPAVARAAGVALAILSVAFLISVIVLY